MVYTYKTIELRFVLLLRLLLRHKLSHSDQDQTRSVLDRTRHDQGWKAEGGFSITNLGNMCRIGAEGTHTAARRSHVAEGHSWGPKAPS